MNPAEPTAPVEHIEGEGVGEGESGEDLLEQARRELGLDDGESEDDAVDAEATAEDKPKKKEKKEEEDAAPEAGSLEAAKKKLEEALAGLTDEQREELLGATDKAFAALTAKQRRFHRRAEAKQQELAVRSAELEGVQADLRELVATARRDPLSALKVFGWSEEDLSDYLTRGDDHPDRRDQRIKDEVLREVEGLKSQLAAERHQGNVARWRESAAGAVEASIAEFPLSARWPRAEVIETVMTIQRGHYAQTKQTLAPEAALRIIEARLQEQHRRLVGTESPHPVRNGAVKTASSEAESEPPLHSRMSSTRGTPARADEEDEFAELSEEDRLAYARRALLSG